MPTDDEKKAADPIWRFPDGNVSYDVKFLGSVQLFDSVKQTRPVESIPVIGPIIAPIVRLARRVRDRLRGRGPGEVGQFRDMRFPWKDTPGHDDR